MIIERSMQDDWLSNAYLVGDEENGKAVVIDSGGPSGPLLEAADEHGLDVELLLLTHHHGDHVAENGGWKAERGVETHRTLQRHDRTAAALRYSRGDLVSRRVERWTRRTIPGALPRHDPELAARFSSGRLSLPLCAAGSMGLQSQAVD